MRKLQNKKKNKGWVDGHERERERKEKQGT
jgi:hypothetical protein